MGRKTDYTVELADKICELLAGGLSMRKICAKADMPSRQTVMAWQAENPDFLTKCARAWEMKADHEFDRMDEIEQKVLSGKIKVDAARVVLGSMQWRLERMKPRTYAPVQLEKQIDDREHVVTGGLPADD